MTTIFFGSDHAGFLMKKEILNTLNAGKEEGTVDKMLEIKDIGCYSVGSCDYQEFAFRVANKVSETPNSFGVLLCGTGIGMSIAANKIKGARCALCNNYTSVNMARKHNDANIIAIGARGNTPEMVLPLILGFIHTEFDGGRHKKRIDMIDSMV